MHNESMKTWFLQFKIRWKVIIVFLQNIGQKLNEELKVQTFLQFVQIIFRKTQ